MNSRSSPVISPSSAAFRTSPRRRPGPRRRSMLERRSETPRRRSGRESSRRFSGCEWGSDIPGTSARTGLPLTSIGCVLRQAVHGRTAGRFIGIERHDRSGDGHASESPSSSSSSSSSSPEKKSSCLSPSNHYRACSPPRRCTRRTVRHSLQALPTDWILGVHPSPVGDPDRRAALSPKSQGSPRRC